MRCSRRRPCAPWASPLLTLGESSVPRTRYTQGRFVPRPRPSALLRLLAKTPRTAVGLSFPSFFLAALTARATIDTSGPHEPLGLPPPYDPGGAAIGPTLPHRKHYFVPIAT